MQGTSSSSQHQNPLRLIIDVVRRAAQLYEAKKAADPEFYRGADSLLYGKDVKDTEAGIERMVAELNQQCVSRCLMHCTLRLCCCLHGCTQYDYEGFKLWTTSLGRTVKRVNSFVVSG